jgi:hypothetical protein
LEGARSGHSDMGVNRKKMLLKNGTLKLLITQEEMDKVPSINEMEKLVSSKLK